MNQLKAVQNRFTESKGAVVHITKENEGILWLCMLCVALSPGQGIDVNIMNQVGVRCALETNCIVNVAVVNSLDLFSRNLVVANFYSGLGSFNNLPM